MAAHLTSRNAVESQVRNRKLDSALAHARAGWPIFMCHNIEGDECSCGKRIPIDRKNIDEETECKSPGKHPIVDEELGLFRGLKHATRDEAKIRRWWKRWPDANIAGRCDGKVVADVDAGIGKDGMATLAALEREHGRLERALVQRTGAGGLHIVFAARTGAAYSGKLGTHIETRVGAGGYIMLPGSDHHTGGSYTWEIGDGASEAYTLNLPYAPTWMERGAPPEKPSGELDALDLAMRERDRLPIWKVKDILDDLPESFLYDYVDWIEVGKALHHHFAGDEDGRHLWHWFSKQGASYDGREIDAKWPTFVKDSGGTTIGTLIHAAGGWANIRGDDDEPETGDDDSAAGERPNGSKLSFFIGDKFDTLPAKFDFVRGLLYDNSVGLIYAKQNVGKTFLALHMACCVALGLPVFGLKTEKRRGLFVALEGEAAFKSRLKAWMIHNGVDDKPIDYALGRFDIVDPKQVRALIELALKIEAEFIVVDTITQAAAGVATNEQKEMSAVIGALFEIKRKTRACVIGLTHPSKTGDTPAGSFVQMANPDTLLEVNVTGDPKSPTHNDQRIVTARKQRDGKNGAAFAFNLIEVETPDLDARNEPIGSVALNEMESFENLDAGAETKLTDREKEALAVFRRLDAIAFINGPVTRDQWRGALGGLTSATWPKVEDARRMAVVRAMKKLEDGKLVTFGRGPAL